MPVLNKTMWAHSAGGPFALIPESLTKSWNAGEDEFEDFSLTDYFSICDAEGLLSSRTIRRQKIFIFNDVPTPITVVKNKGKTYFIRWITCRERIDKNITAETMAVISKLPFEKTKIKPFTLKGMYFLFDSAICPQLPLFTREAIAVRFRENCYRIDSAEYTPSKSTNFFVHRFSKDV